LADLAGHYGHGQVAEQMGADYLRKGGQLYKLYNQFLEILSSFYIKKIKINRKLFYKGKIHIFIFDYLKR
jgi:hypothetical protein